MSAKKSKLKKERLVNSQRRRTLLTWTRVVRYGLRNFTRNAWLTVAATAVMTITLLIIFVTAVASSVLSETHHQPKGEDGSVLLYSLRR